ncbi:transposase [Patescibacteria group bacterium]
MQNIEFKQKPPRLFIDNSQYFLTFNTYKRKNLLVWKTIPKLLLDSIDFLCEDLYLKKIAFVILSDHIHLLLECKNSKNISSFLRRFKSYSSNKIKELTGTDGFIWQRGTFDHVINDEDDYWNHLEYIHYNPVKHGYTTKPEDWEYSSYLKFVKKGYFDIGWGWEDINVKYKKGYSFGE